ncbi:DUF1613-domain-containing protein [Dendrothele bispora CBS 962.96]|uniref:tRNA (uracil-O(2)-)-methyltransferase n=1 Tax=Dendrothele bispora (strain CBS 962.96) TaxID=1314807 RepID=A0A4S8KU08_DENBC|nr:DUF1613-domain-containing protein [Dendrothele bispora CBS 962.96]
MANGSSISALVSSTKAFQGSNVQHTHWTPLVLCPANFPQELFEIAISQLVHHPEYNSTLILRSEVIADIYFDSGDSRAEDILKEIPELNGRRPTRCIHRRLLPRRPGRDASLEQYCTLYTSSDDINMSSESHDNELATVDTLVLTPITSSEQPLPYYHPRVSHLAFRHLDDPSSLDQLGTLRIEVIPLPDVESPQDPNGRLYRTCLALLDTLHRYGWGAVTNYQKRVHHDILISRERYQDLYLVMRERHKGLVETWQEVTDPLKHVFEDIGIATYLMLLWKDTFKEGLDKFDDEKFDGHCEPWRDWPRPPGGFLDLGCGNGLLTHILTSEGYTGNGIDPNETPSHSKFFPEGVFIIANHADELTPWTPVLATLYSASGYLSIPCCAWTFDARYSRSKSDIFLLPEGKHRTVDEFARTLALGGDGSNSSGYSMYRIWLASLSLYCGWEIECETLRIPSTRNWALVGRKSALEVPKAVALEHVEEIIAAVKRRGVFKPRKPEGKEDGH